MMKAAKNLRDQRDRISSLPDCLLHLIMSSLTSLEAVRTCILSKRWKNLWKTLPYLNFNTWDFEDDCESEDGEPTFRRFTDFVNMTLLLREATDLHKFRLSCEDMPAHVNNMFKTAWIRYVIKHNPQVLEINTIIRDSLPVDVFSCASLVDLSLSFGFRIPHSLQYQNNILSVNLPFLRRLHLQDVFVNQDFGEKLFCGCPMLEFLHLQRCKILFSSICSQSLKHILLERFCSFEGTNKMELIDTPNLLSFHYWGCIGYIGDKMLLNMPSLATASICWEGGSCCQYNGKSNILTGISSVQSLRLNGSCIKDILLNEVPTCPEFQNLKDLSVINLCLNCQFNLLASFLDHLPNMKKLSLSYFGWCHKCQVELDRNQVPLRKARFRCKQLEKVDVTFSHQDTYFHWVLKYLLEATHGSQARIKMISW